VVDLFDEALDVAVAVTERHAGSHRMSRSVLRIGAIAVAMAGVGLAVIVQGMLAPMPPTGPLALVEPQPGSPQARTEGVLEITDECVRLVHPDDTRSLLIWFRGSVTWNATDRSVAMADPGGGDLTLRSGDAVSVTGGGGPIATLDSVGSWVRRPGDDCTAPEWFLAVDVQAAQAK
jgi:hypothetical protein